MREVSAYLHFPWCLQKCPYCDFASATIERNAVPHTEYADAVLRELGWRTGAEALGDARLVSVFFGGGTPSLWDARELGRVLTAVRAAFAAEAADLEITVECNPSSLDRRKAAELRAAGVTRLSIGVQSLNEERLRYLGRLHDGPMALRALGDALAEIPRVSGDLMFGMPGQKAVDFAAEARRILDTGVAHVSAYALTIEPNTRFGELARKGRLPIATEDDFAETFLHAEATFAAAGLEHYEVSNYARPGEESRHNLHYWRGGDYLGLGAGAVGRIGDRRWRNQAEPRAYLAASGSAAVEVFEERLGPRERIGEALLLGLRTREGVDLATLAARAGEDFRSGPRGQALDRRSARGDVILQGSRLSVPRSRWLHLDGIVADLF